MTADIGSTDRVLAIEGERLGWTTGGSAADARVMERRATPAVPARPRASVRPVGVTRPSDRSSRVRRTRRGLAVSLAGLAFGVLASAATTNAPSSAAPSRPGESPGTTTARLVVGNTSPMDVSRAFLFRRPAGGTLAPAAPNPGR
jgi:hypothetical protein